MNPLLPRKNLCCFDRDAIADLLRQAGSIALAHYHNPEISLKNDLSIVTQADCAIEQLLAVQFDRPEEEIYLIGEETVESRSESYLDAALHSDCTLIVDPIDGTAPYSAQIPLWGISIALLRRGVIVAGAVYLPVQDACIYAANAQVQHRPLRAPGAWAPFHAQIHPDDASGGVSIAQSLAKRGNIQWPHPVFAWGGCVGSLYQLVTGKILAYAAAVKLWDIAGFLPILEACGFVLVKRNGETVSADLAHGDFELDAEAARRWHLKVPAIVSTNKIIAQTLFEGIKSW